MIKIRWDINKLENKVSNRDDQKSSLKRVNKIDIISGEKPK